jgi:hypothetical protein
MNPVQDCGAFRNIGPALSAAAAVTLAG